MNTIEKDERNIRRNHEKHTEVYMKKNLFKAVTVSCIAIAVIAAIGYGVHRSKDGSNKVNKPSEKMITVTDAIGKVEIPANPKRIVDLSGNSDILSILGYKVVGTENSDAYDYTKFPSYLENTLKGAKILGYSMQDTVNIGAVMNLNPDLIIISPVQEKMYKQLSEIAPTIIVKSNPLNWKDNVEAFAKIFNKEDVANKWLATYEAKAKEAGNKIKEEYGKNTTYLSVLASGGQFFVFDNAGFGSVLYKDMGLAKPVGMPKQSDISLPVVTYEGLTSIKADYIFLMATPKDLAELKKNAIWNNLPQVKDGHVVVLNASPYFNQGYSPIGKNLLVSEIGGMLNETKNKPQNEAK